MEAKENEKAPVQMNPKQLAEKALVELTTQREKLKAQEASIPETLQTTMQACEVSLMLVIRTLDILATHNAMIGVFKDLATDSERLHDAATTRLNVLGRT